MPGTLRGVYADEANIALVPGSENNTLAANGRVDGCPGAKLTRHSISNRDIFFSFFSTKMNITMGLKYYHMSSQCFSYPTQHTISIMIMSHKFNFF